MYYVNVPTPKLRSYCKLALGVHEESLEQYMGVNGRRVIGSINNLINTGQLLFHGHHGRRVTCQATFESNSHPNRAMAYFLNGNMFILANHNVTEIKSIYRIDVGTFERLQKKVHQEDMNNIHKYLSLLFDSIDTCLTTDFKR